MWGQSLRAAGLARFPGCARTLHPRVGVRAQPVVVKETSVVLAHRSQGRARLAGRPTSRTRAARALVGNQTDVRPKPRRGAEAADVSDLRHDRRRNDDADAAQSLKPREKLCARRGLGRELAEPSSGSRRTCAATCDRGAIGTTTAAGARSAAPPPCRRERARDARGPRRASQPEARRPGLAREMDRLRAAELPQALHDPRQVVGPGAELADRRAGTARRQAAPALLRLAGRFCSGSVRRRRFFRRCGPAGGIRCAPKHLRTRGSLARASLGYS